MAPAEISWLAVGAATVVYQVFQLGWYNKFVLGGLWAHGLGYETYDDVDRSQFWVGVGISTIGAFIASVSLDILLDWTAAANALEGALVGGLVGLGFNVATGAQLIHLEERPVLLYLLNALYNLFALAGIGAVLVLVGGPTPV